LGELQVFSGRFRPVLSRILDWPAMSDTLQYLSWHLEYACAFRRGAAVTDLLAARAATGELHAIDGAAARGDLYGDICVQGTSYSRAGVAPVGFRIGETVNAVGGLTAAREICGQCPANALNPTPGGMAGCCGVLEIEPTQSVEDQLRSALLTSGLRRSFANVFLETRPLWYGLWVSSPLSPAQLEMMGKVLTPAMGEGVVQFLSACDVAVEHGIRLHVRMSPPGHVDFGFHTTFPHCPRCKMGNGEEWKSPYSSEVITCEACGFRYVPAETAAMESMDREERPELEAVLSPAEFEHFMVEWRKRHAAEVAGGVDGLLDQFRQKFKEEVAASAQRRSWRRRAWEWIRGRRR
jgi:hypothetical protein